MLDPFMGVGGVLLGASLAGRTATGIEINPEWIDIYREVCRLEGIAEQEALAGDSPASCSRRSAGGRSTCVLTDVPYWRMDRAPRSRGDLEAGGGEGDARRGAAALARLRRGAATRTSRSGSRRMGAIFARGPRRC